MKGKLEDADSKRIVFTFPYSKRTKNSKLIFYIKEAVRISYNLESSPGLEPEILYKGKYFPLHKHSSTAKLIKYLDANHLEFIYKSGIGEAYATINGVKYFVHSNENGITPHIHARYQGEELSIDLLTFEVTGSFKSRTKEKEALRFTKTEQLSLIEFYNGNTNGIKISFDEARRLVKQL